MDRVYPIVPLGMAAMALMALLQLCAAIVNDNIEAPQALSVVPSLHI